MKEPIKKGMNYSFEKKIWIRMNIRFITLNFIAHDKHLTSQTIIFLSAVKKMTK